MKKVLLVSLLMGCSVEVPINEEAKSAGMGNMASARLGASAESEVSALDEPVAINPEDGYTVVVYTAEDGYEGIYTCKNPKRVWIDRNAHNIYWDEPASLELFDYDPAPEYGLGSTRISLQCWNGEQWEQVNTHLYSPTTRDLYVAADAGKFGELSSFGNTVLSDPNFEGEWDLFVKEAGLVYDFDDVAYGEVLFQEKSEWNWDENRDNITSEGLGNFLLKTTNAAEFIDEFKMQFSAGQNFNIKISNYNSAASLEMLVVVENGVITSYSNIVTKSLVGERQVLLGTVILSTDTTIPVVNTELDLTKISLDYYALLGHFGDTISIKITSEDHDSLPVINFVKTLSKTKTTYDVRTATCNKSC